MQEPPTSDTPVESADPMAAHRLPEGWRRISEEQFASSAFFSEHKTMRYAQFSAVVPDFMD